jgi:murein DD-endopeptidase MepM/ murein hydrolase activator NlpD
MKSALLTCASLGALTALGPFLAGCGGASCVGDSCAQPDGGEGAADAAAAAADAAPYEVSLARVVGTEGAGLNLRRAPSPDAEVLSQIPAGELVDVRGPGEGAWLPIHHEGADGWGHGEFLELLDGDQMLFLLPWTAGDTFRVTQGHNTGSHTGAGAWAWDFGMPVGTPLLSSHAGIVRAVKGDSTIGGCDAAYRNDGNYVVVDRGNGLETLYLHLDDVAVSVGDPVARGQLLGTSGQTGWACGPHLHFQIQRSPDGGGTQSWYNPSVAEYFYDSGEPWDPPLGAEPVSRNGELDLP